MSEKTTGLSQLSDIEEKCVIVDEYIIGFIGIVMATYYLISIRRQLNQSNHHKYYRYAIYCAILSFIFSLGVFSVKLIFANDLLIKWNGFTSHKTSFVSIVDSLTIFLFAMEKLCLYYAFTFNSQSLINATRISCFLKFWIVGTAINITVACVVYITDDALIYTPAEIGITKKYNFHIAMYLGHQGAELIQYVLFFIIIVDIGYFIYILYLYINGLKTVNSKTSVNIYVEDVYDNRTQGVKGVVLIIFVSVIYCINVTIIALDVEVKYLFSNITLISDNLCLFLMFKSSQKLYNNTCGRICDNCWIKCVYGTKYQVVYADDDSDEEHGTDDLYPH
eukprot:400966_1